MPARRWIGATAVLTLTIAGCGGLGSDGGASEPPTIRVASAAGGSSEIVSIELAGPEARIRRNGWSSTPAWSPDGKRVAYFGWLGARGEALYVDDLDGDPEAVTGPLSGGAAPDLSTAPAQAPLWSPDGERIAFRRADADVSVVGLDGAESWTVPTRRLVNDWAGIGLAWAPDGERLAVTIDWGRHRGTWIAERNRLRPFRPGGRPVLDPAWSPDGQWIAYSHDDGRGSDQIYLSSVEHDGAIRVTNDLPRRRGAHFSNSDPVWSPDGSAIAFLSNREGRHSTELFVVGADGFGQRRLTRGVAVTRFPAGFGGGRTPAVRWSPDGRRIAFLGWSWYVHPQIGVVDVDGRNLRRLVAAPTDDGYVAGFDLAWLGEPERSDGPSQVPALPVPERRVPVVRDHLPDGPVGLGPPRVVLRAPVADSTDDEYVDVSADGSRLSFLARLSDHRFDVGVLDLRDGSRRVLTTGATSGSLERGGRFSPSGRTILFRRWTELLTVDVETGAVRRVAARAGEGPISWLADGRVTFVDPAGRLRFGGQPTAVRTGKWRAVAVRPDGKLAVVRARCNAVLVDVRSGRRRPLGWGLLPDADSWSPNGSFIALHRPDHDECGPRLGTRGGDVVVFDRAGREVGTLLGAREPFARGASLRWAPDSRLLLALVDYHGTRPPPKPLYVFSAADRTVGRATVDTSRWGDPVGVARGRAVFVRHDWPDERQFVVARLP